MARLITIRRGDRITVAHGASFDVIGAFPPEHRQQAVGHIRLADSSFVIFLSGCKSYRRTYAMVAVLRVDPIQETDHWTPGYVLRSSIIGLSQPIAKKPTALLEKVNNEGAVIRVSGYGVHI